MFPCFGENGGFSKSTTSAAIDNQIKDDRAKEDKLIKLLLLGTGDSGKSTFSKQMKVLYSGGFSQKELESYKETLMNRTMLSIHMLLKAVATLEVHIPSRYADEWEAVMEAKELSPEIAKTVSDLWSHYFVQKVYRRRNEFQLDSNAKYYFKHIIRFTEEDFVPTLQDVLKVRQKTSGVLETKFDLDDGLKVNLVDVGGQRSERRKWLHCFEDVTAVVYFISLDEYNLSLAEDYRYNRLKEALELFEETTTAEVFSNTHFFVFFNKNDLFTRKIKRFPLPDYFPDFKGEATYETSLAYLQELFQARFGGDDAHYHPYVVTSTHARSVGRALSKMKVILAEKYSEL